MPPDDLANLQRSLFQTITSLGDSAMGESAVYVKPGSSLSSEERIQIYSKQYWYRLFDCLSEDFPGVRSLLAPSEYESLVESYLRSYPSTSYSLNILGENFAEYCARLELPTVIIDMATLKWAHARVFLSPNANAELSPPEEGETLFIRLNPSVAPLTLSYNVDEYKIALQGEEPDPPVQMKVSLVVHRPDEKVFYKRVDPRLFSILEFLRDEQPLECLVDEIMNRFESPEQVDELCRRLAEWKWVSFEKRRAL